MPENRLLTALRTALRLALEHLGLAAPPIHYIGGSDVLPPPLPRDEEEAAIRGLAEGDEAHRAHQGHQHLQRFQEQQTRDLRLALHRKRDTHVPAQMRLPARGGEL